MVAVAMNCQIFIVVRIGGSEGGPRCAVPPLSPSLAPLGLTVLLLPELESCIHTVFRSIESQWANRRQQL